MTVKLFIFTECDIMALIIDDFKLIDSLLDVFSRLAWTYTNIGYNVPRNKSENRHRSDFIGTMHVRTVVMQAGPVVSATFPCSSTTDKLICTQNKSLLMVGN